MAQIANQMNQKALKEHEAAAVRSMREALRLPTNLQDATILSTALARVAAREIQQNSRFGSEVRKEYDALLASRGQSVRRATSGTKVLEPLVPLRHLGGNPDPYAPPNPHDLIYVYGADKLGRALHEYTLDMLKQTSATIEATHPGTKPKNKSSKQSVIDYIVQHS